ncbi:hypothetical protein CC85DRAFT_330332 [Cutaneotrichosporon oleaginosum]|uniref:F-box domain-containing protein n=1 Tax=Cutaneotrichosporon oleaginosum TaxID=879819 RepID=A0A0J1AXA7_9TREE|nr:uncharacterized protein CC85DRAFT_330332 [Cutaneotrichosporon oleaginosum]KLT39934.1 hypothetical protein CC85DRAFT_330332 [Cutaneotrichosporon oleaginosum]TXT08348.1 hypothetical protein COLE_05272 [Cutaneotrichosporon oleaginosum]
MLVPIAFVVVVTVMFALRRRETPEDTPEGGPCLILELPSEILERVLANLDLDGLVAASQTCCALREVAKAPRLAYRAALAARGYLDVPNRPAPPPWPLEGASIETSPYSDARRATIPSVELAAWEEDAPPRRDVSALSAAEKLRLLAEREQRFDKLMPAEVREFSVSGPAGVYELQDGIFLLCQERSISHSVRPTKIRLIPLASSVDPDIGSPIIPCKEVDVGFPIADLTMDPSQDLIVVSEHSPPRASGHAPIHRFHLLSLSTGEPHPLAKFPTLDAPPWVHGEMSHVSQQLLQVMDSTLVVLIAVQDELTAVRAAYEEELFAWNWKTGVVLGRRSLGETLARTSMALLTPTTVALTMPAVIGPTLREMFGGVPGFMDNQNPVFIHPPSIDIFSFAHDPSKPAPTSTAPLERSESDSTSPRFVLVVRLLLPPMRAGSMVSQMHMRPDPAFPPVPSQQATLGVRPFTQDPRRGVIVIELAMDDDHLVMPMRMRSECYEMFILRETLIQMAEEGEERLHDIWHRNAVKRAERRNASSPASSSGSSTPGDPDMIRSRSRSPPRSRNGSPASPASASGHADDRQRTYSAKPRRKHHADSPTRTFEWDEWGEHSTRVMPPPQLMRRLWVCSCSGYRYASLVRRPASSHGFSTELCVHDFNPHWWAGKRMKPSTGVQFVGAPETHPAKDAAGNQALPSVGGSPAPTVIKSDAWEVDIVTRLPYRTVLRRLDHNPMGVMIDDQRIMLVNHQVQEHNWLGMVQHIQTWCM